MDIPAPNNLAPLLLRLYLACPPGATVSQLTIVAQVVCYNNIGKADGLSLSKASFAERLWH